MAPIRWHQEDGANLAQAGSVLPGTKTGITAIKAITGKLATGKLASEELCKGDRRPYI